MKRATKLALFGAAAAAVGGLLYRRYQDSYEQLPEEELDFVMTEQSDDDFEHIDTEYEALCEE